MLELWFSDNLLIVFLLKEKGNALSALIILSCEMKIDIITMSPAYKTAEITQTARTDSRRELLIYTVIKK